MQPTSHPSTGPLAALAASFGITDTTPAQSELCIRDGLLARSSTVYSLAAPAARPGGLPAHHAEAEKYRGKLGAHQVVANVRKWRWEQSQIARGRAAMQVKDALLLSLEQNAKHVPVNVRARAVINLYVTHHAARPMTAGLLRSLRDAEASQFRDFKAYSDFRDQFQIDPRYDPVPSVAKPDSLEESDFQRVGVAAGLDDDDAALTVHTPKSDPGAAPRSVAMASSISSSTTSSSSISSSTPSLKPSAS